MKWDILKAAIADIIKANDNQEITGDILQSALDNIVSSVGENAAFAGIATTTINPGAYDGPVFFFATTPGVYPNFSGVEVLENELVVLYFSFDENIWKKHVIMYGSAIHPHIVEVINNVLSLFNITYAYALCYGQLHDKNDKLYIKFANATFNLDGSFDDGKRLSTVDIEIPTAQVKRNGLMSASDKHKLNSIISISDDELDKILTK